MWVLPWNHCFIFIKHSGRQKCLSYRVIPVTSGVWGLETHHLRKVAPPCRSMGTLKGTLPIGTFYRLLSTKPHLPFKHQLRWLVFLPVLPQGMRRCWYFSGLDLLLSCSILIQSLREFLYPLQHLAHHWCWIHSLNVDHEARAGRRFETSYCNEVTDSRFPKGPLKVCQSPFSQEELYWMFSQVLCGWGLASHTFLNTEHNKFPAPATQRQIGALVLFTFLVLARKLWSCQC